MTNALLVVIALFLFEIVLQLARMAKAVNKIEHWLHIEDDHDAQADAAWEAMKAEQARTHVAPAPTSPPEPWIWDGTHVGKKN